MLTAHEQNAIDRANASGAKPVVFVHGLWLLPSSWDRWKALFEENGYVGLAPGWPDDPETVQEARRSPEVFARKTVQQVTDHYLEAIAKLDRRPAVVGHSFGGLITMKIAGVGAADGAVAIDSAPFRGVLPLPRESLKSASPVLRDPRNRRKAVSLTFEQFRFGWANHVDEDEARRLYDEYHVPAPGTPLFQAATANLNPFTEAKVDSRNPARGPLLIIAGVGDNTTPPAIQKAILKLQNRNPGTTEYAELPERGHSLVIDHGWEEVAQVALSFLTKVAT
ncbi:Esterase/lipase [Actinopolymorpha cephalotaxi]|uniref:Esterase/lipase n=1 Tax=Actinopolymorpha cephalotaxi TaxID=504797 RepID=A0A1I2LG27_9ACTN|nr:alpha/beta hydrolase [Actinopolymorpha cephalotaxi]NYH84998.1 pimeloyl-ACP methyl ester carboxylesterase [Actinopolymorpha cephalotaxi]SFF76036.1 Esterase/lipase [Actinopolymorpha cephalotaxi]